MWDQDVRELAYTLWERSPWQTADENWLQAERELTVLPLPALPSLLSN